MQLRRLLPRLARGASVAVLGGSTAAAWGEVSRADGGRSRVGSVPSLDAFDPDENESYKEQFQSAYDAAAMNTVARRSSREGSDSIAGEEGSAEKRIFVRRGIARHLMSKLGYSDDELLMLGDDVLRMQGVSSPFRAAALQQGESVLDLGSGFGVDCFLACKKVGEAGSVVGLDISGEEVSAASDRAIQRGLASRCRFVKGDMEQLPFADQSFDVVLSNGGFCLCPDKRAAFSEIFRALRPGGRIAIACTVLRAPLPSLDGRQTQQEGQQNEAQRWPPCMEVFMLQSTVKPLLSSLGYHTVSVDDSNSRMDVWDMTERDVATVGGVLGDQGSGADACSHARRAAARRAGEAVSSYLSQEREAGIHTGSAEFEFTTDGTFDMNELCARVVITAQKPL